jgi:hypothetical protein
LYGNECMYMHMHGESHLGRSFNRVVSRVPAYLSVAPEQHVNPAPAVLLTPTLPSTLGLRRVSFYPARTPLDFKTFLAFQLVQHLHPFCLQATRQTIYISHFGSPKPEVFMYTFNARGGLPRSGRFQIPGLLFKRLVFDFHTTPPLSPRCRNSRRS